jgi:hypothetical protein
MLRPSTWPRVHLHTPYDRYAAVTPARHPTRRFLAFAPHVVTSSATTITGALTAENARKLVTLTT